jgi:hypothetical protein
VVVLNEAPCVRWLGENRPVMFIVLPDVPMSPGEQSTLWRCKSMLPPTGTIGGGSPRSIDSSA